MANFAPILATTLRHEGGFTVDTGGRTMRGVTQAVWDKFKADTGKYQGVDVAQISEAMASEVYRRNYWNPIMGDAIASQAVASVLFDWGVNAGVGRAVKAVQGLVGVPQDGGFGPVTLAAVNRAGDNLANQLTEARIRFYKELAASNPEKYGKYLAGWLKRATSFFFETATKPTSILMVGLGIGVMWATLHALTRGNDYGRG